MRQLLLLISFLICGTSKGDSRNVQLTADDANSFMKIHHRVRRGLYHECYEEGCDFEEVREVHGYSPGAYEYYYTYTCSKFGQNCKVTCKYRQDCGFGLWGGWNGKVDAANPGCYSQWRSKPYKHPLQTIKKRPNCNGLHTQCPAPPVENRKQCVCQKANCQPGNWEEWTGDINEGTCVTQTRIRPYDLTWSLDQQIGSCAGIQTTCPAPETDMRKMCSCSKAECSLGDWGEWEGKAVEGTCSDQKRKREYTKAIVYKNYIEECPSLPQECPDAVEESRQTCSCQYAKCTLGEWSDWEPKELEHGQCGQRQTRRKSYSLTVAYQVHVDKCPSLPQKCPDEMVENRTQCECTFRDSCDLHPWSQWATPLTEEGCEVQTRTRQYVHPLRHSAQEDCSGLLTSCITEPKESRNFCKCKYVDCKLGNWSDWSSAELTTGQCGKEKRFRDYIPEQKFKFGETCDELPTSCPVGKEENRTVCKCPYVTCHTSEWSSWQGSPPAEGCVQQMRSKTVTAKDHEKMQDDNCDGLKTSCPSIPPDTRQWCNCSFREDCVLKEWTDWSGQIPDVGCTVQIRTRDYNKSIEWLERETCDGLDSCPAIREDTRTNCNCNQIICAWGNWTRTSFNPETNCYIEERVKNESSGFKKVQQMDSCAGIPIECDNSEVERIEDCVSGGGGHEVHTSPPPKTRPSTTAVKPTTGFEPATYVAIGCFKDEGVKPRPLPLLIANKRAQIDWYNLGKTVQQCAEVAKKKRLEYFSVQFFGECWSGPNAGKTFARDGESKKCYKGVGDKNANYVYRLEDLPQCSKEVSFTTTASSGEITGQSWCARDSSEFPRVIIDFGGERQISGVGTQGGDKDSWVTTYTLEWSEEGEDWQTYQEDGRDKLFTGNSDRFTLETRWLKHPITAGFLRFRPQSWTATHICMKIRIFGCNV